MHTIVAEVEVFEGGGQLALAGAGAQDVAREVEDLKTGERDEEVTQSGNL